MNTVLTYLAPLVVFGLVVFVHELGHFLAAKLTGVYAPVFSLGWGSRLFGIRRGETDYRVSMFPIGGYVRMATREDDSMAGIEGGRDRGDFAAGAPQSQVKSALWDDESMAPFGPKAVPVDRFVEAKSTGARVLIMSAGVIMNILLAITVASGLYKTYGGQYRPAVIDSVVVGMPAADAGFRHNDEIVAVNGTAISGWNDFVSRVQPVTQGSITVQINRNGERITRTLTPQAGEVFDSVSGKKIPVARVGIQVRSDTIAKRNVSLADAVAVGSRLTWENSKLIGSTMRGLVSGNISPKNLGGPIMIARQSVAAAKSGIEALLELLAMLSLNIALLNLVPIPVLDGGQILLVVAERIKGSAFSANVREGFARVGVIAVLGLFVLVMFNDVKSWIVG
ncbi:MAG: RIP metalloprotease RseP [Gemmatimonadota bacterium]|nr:RIP metalloprotease RseP [Gemmatimonadota bacterium]